MACKLNVHCFRKLIDIDQETYVISPEETVLVTGANGFIGSRVVRTLLTNGFSHLRCLTRATSRGENLENITRESGATNIEIIKGNLLSREICQYALKGVSVIYHLAAGVEKSFPGCILNSAVTTKNLLDAAINERSIKRFVNVSSIAVYSL